VNACNFLPFSTDERLQSIETSIKHLANGGAAIAAQANAAAMAAGVNPMHPSGMGMGVPPPNPMHAGYNPYAPPPPPAMPPALPWAPRNYVPPWRQYQPHLPSMMPQMMPMMGGMMPPMMPGMGGMYPGMMGGMMPGVYDGRGESGRRRRGRRDYSSSDDDAQPSSRQRHRAQRAPSPPRTPSRRPTTREMTPYREPVDVTDNNDSIPVGFAGKRGAGRRRVNPASMTFEDGDSLDERPMSAKDRVLLVKQARKEAQEEAMANELRKARVAYHNEKQR